MRLFEDNISSLSTGFGRVRNIDPITAACMEIARLRSSMVEHAYANGNVNTDENNNPRGIKAEKYRDIITNVITLFKGIRHSTDFYSHSAALARDATRGMKMRPDVTQMRQSWPKMNHQEKIEGLRQLSALMIDSLNKSEYSLCLNYPSIAIATFPKATRDLVGMLLQQYSIGAGRNPPLMHLISVNRETLDKADFNQVSAMLWHEHHHIYMGGMRSCLQQGFISNKHPQFDEIQRSDTITKYRITGNIGTCKDIYHAEPEEDLCAYVQDIFQKTFSYIPETGLKIQHG